MATKIIPRLLRRRLPPANRRTLVVLTGARQTGKTTLARQHYAGLRYINLDALEYRDQLRNVSAFGWGRTVGPAVLDEAQKLPEVFEKVKFAYDDGQLTFSVLLGPAQILLLKKVRESLAGRVLLRELWPLMPCELLADETGEIRDPLLGKLLKGPADEVLSAQPEVLLGPEWEHRRQVEEYFLRWGGMPALLPLDDEQRRDWFASYEVTYLERDLSDLSRLDDLLPFRKCQQLAALRSGCLLNYSELARDSGVSVETARRYLEYLRLSYQAWFLEPYSGNPGKRLVKTPKLYWVDMGIRRHLTGKSGPVDGAGFETYVVTEIMKYLRTAGLETKMSFYRTRAGFEVDLVLESQSGVMGMEIRLAERVGTSDATALRRLAKECGESWHVGLVIYRGQRLFRLADRVWAVPSAMLLT